MLNETSTRSLEQRLRFANEMMAVGRKGELIGAFVGSQLRRFLRGRVLPSATTTMFPTLRVLSAVAGMPFKRSQLGLFHGKMRQTGNSVPFSKHKTRRSWLPNVHNKRLTSVALQTTMRLKVTTRALRTIKKVFLIFLDVCAVLTLRLPRL